MSGVAVSTQDIAAAAREFELACRESQQLLERLERVAGGLGEGWAGQSGETFFKHLAEWQGLMRSQAGMLVSISLELRALADRFQRADS
jgi:WXG100 family type VII secretion target